MQIPFVPRIAIAQLSRLRYIHTYIWALLVSAVVVAIAAALARATLNMNAALTSKPDLAIYLLLPEEEIGQTTLLRSTETERDYLAETKNGPKLIRLKKGEKQWFVSSKERLHE